METAQECDDPQGAGQGGGDDSCEDSLRARFNALSKRDQSAILDKHRDWNVDHEWYEFQYDMFKEAMMNRGFYVYDIRFSGFCSQGDGASFSGHVHHFSAFWSAHGITLPLVKEILDQRHTNTISLQCVRTAGVYAHSGMMNAEDDFHVDDPTFDHPLERAAWGMKKVAAEQEWTDFVARSIVIFRDHANQLYRDLETEYDYLTSDEQVLESLIANDHLEQALERYESDSPEEDHEGQDAAPVQELLLRAPGAVSEAG